ncbi:MAG: response regulator transcription factor [Chloroflexi bacterium]|nr:response regulator transcription factor [Chloroflexota bacterium]
MRPISVLVISAHSLWLQALSQTLESYQGAQEVKVTSVVVDAEQHSRLTRALSGCHPDVAVVSLDLPVNSFDSVRKLRSSGFLGEILLICSRYSVPEFDELVECNVQSIISSALSLEELVYAIHTQIDEHLEALLHQWLWIRQTRHLQPQHRLLNDREKEILQLAADDLTDQAIADRLGISVRTVNNHLRYIYSKLGVRGRAGAVAAAIARRIIVAPLVIIQGGGYLGDLDTR